MAAIEQKRPGGRRRLGQVQGAPSGAAEAGKPGGGAAGQGGIGMRLAVEHRHRHGGENPFPAVPARHLHQVVGAHQPDEADAREAAFQRHQGIGGEPGAEAAFHVGDPDRRVADDRPRALHPFVQRQQGTAVLQRILRADQPPDLVQVQAFDRRQADEAVSLVRRVERSAEQADGAAAAVSRRGQGAFADQIGARRRAHGQTGRT